MTEQQTRPPRNEPATEAGRDWSDALTRFRDWSADPNVKQVLRDVDGPILAIEAEARDAALREQTRITPIDVERLAEAMGNVKWAWLGWVDGEPPNNDMRFRRWTALRNAANELAAEYAALPRTPGEEERDE